MPRHSRQDRYCGVCDHEFSRPAEFRRHIESTLKHNPLNARQHACRFCGDRFINAANCKVHEANHIVAVDADKLCGLPLSNGTGLCSYSCTMAHSMVKHMQRAHPEAYKKAQGNLPEWIESKKPKKPSKPCISKATRAKLEHQVKDAQRKSKRGATPQVERRSKGKVAQARKVEPFHPNTMEPAGPEVAGDDTPVSELSKMGSSTFSSSSDTDPTPSTSGRTENYDTVPLSLPFNDYRQFSRSPSTSYGRSENYDTVPPLLSFNDYRHFSQLPSTPHGRTGYYDNAPPLPFNDYQRFSRLPSASYGQTENYDTTPPPLPLNDYQQFSRFPPSVNFSIPMPVPRDFTNDFGPIIFNDFVSWGRAPSGELNMFNDVASNSFPQLPDSRYPLENSASAEWSHDLHFGATSSRGQADLDFFDYSQLTSAADTFTAFSDGL